MFVREVSRAQDQHHELPLLLFIQGVPEGSGPRPVGIGGWIDAALDRDRVVLLEQHGNGGSTPISATTMQRFDSAQAGTDYLVKFRADSKTSRHGSPLNSSTEGLVPESACHAALKLSMSWVGQWPRFSSTTSWRFGVSVSVSGNGHPKQLNLCS